MRIVVVAPGHRHSTMDVYTGLCAGLAAAGADVVRYPLHDTLMAMELVVGAARQAGIAPPHGYPDPRMLATNGIPGYAMAKRADWVLVVHGLNVPPSIPHTLRRGGYRTAVLLTESPYQMDEERVVAAAYDVALTTDAAAVPELRHPCAHALAHAYNPAVHTPDGPRAPACDVFFCGTRYPERAALLTGVDWTGIDVRDRSIDVHDPAGLDKVLDNTQVASHYRSARISLNQHRQTVHPARDGVIAPGTATALNPRAYEIPACGGFMVSDARAELPAVFGDSVPVYTDSASLEGMLRFYLAHDDERRVLAARQFAAVRAHSWTARAADLLAILAAHAAAPASRAA